MSLPKVAILLLRGLEGSGVTNYSRHMQAYYDSEGGTCDIFVLNASRRIGRPDTSGDIRVNYFTWADRQSVVSSLNANYDVILVFSVPDVKQSDEIKNNYVSEILDKISKRKVMVNHDHHAHTFKRNAGFAEAINSCDLVMAHALDKTSSGFITWMEKNKCAGKPMEKIDIFFHIPFIQHLINYDQKNRKKRVIHASRAVAWKRASLVLHMQKLLAQKGFITELIGFERSLAGFTQINNYKDSLDFFTTNQFVKPVKSWSAFSKAELNTQLMDYLDTIVQDPEKIYILGSYDYRRGLRRVAESAFASQPRTFEHNKLSYGNTFIEYQGIEAALLSVPFFHRHFLDNVTVPGTTTPLSSTGIFLSIDDDAAPLGKGGPKVLNPEKFVDQLESIWSSPTEYAKYRKNSTEFMQKYFGSDRVKPMMARII